MTTHSSPWTSKWELVQERLGAGGQGTTHLVRSRANGELAVVKELRFPNDPQSRQRMRLEVVALETLAECGANVPLPIDHNLEMVDQLDAPLYFAMEYREGQSLDSYIEENGPRPLAESLEIVQQIGETIAIGHREKLIHRDLKPKNIVLAKDSDGRRLAVVLDYGISFNSSHDEGVTRTAESFWNEFLSLPETNVAGDDRRDFRSDVTALCGLLFFCLTGRSPQLLLDSDGRPPHKRPGVDLAKMIGEGPNGHVDAMFTQGFRLKVNERYQSIHEFVDALSRVSQRDGAAESLTLSEIAARESQLLMQHDRATQLEDLKKPLKELTKQLGSALAKSISGQNLGRFRLSQRQDSNLSHVISQASNLEFCYPPLPAQSLSVPPHPHFRDVSYAIGISGDRYVVVRVERLNNPGAWTKYQEVMSFPVDAEEDFRLAGEDFREWIAKSMQNLRAQIVQIEQSSGK